MKKVLITFPGKLGDLLYTLPVAIGLKRILPCEIDYMTSEFCEAAIPLLKEQPCVNDAFIDEKYVQLSDKCGIQPADMSEPEGYDHIYHLGFRREIIGSPIRRSHLIDAHFATMLKRYDIDLEPRYHGRYLWAKPKQIEDYVVFSAYGESLHGSIYYRQNVAAINRYFIDLLKKLRKRVVIITGPQHYPFYEKFDQLITIPSDLSEAADIISKARGFIGVQSCPYVIADGLRVPLLVLKTFSHVMPLGDNGLTFTVDQPIDSVVSRFSAYL